MQGKTYFVPHKTFKRDKTQLKHYFVPLKTFKRYGMSRVNGFVPLIRSNRTNRNARTILFHLKRLIGTECQ